MPKICEPNPNYSVAGSSFHSSQTDSLKIAAQTRVGDGRMGQSVGRSVGRAVVVVVVVVAVALVCVGGEMYGAASGVESKLGWES